MPLTASGEDWVVLLESVTDELVCDYKTCDRPGSAVVVWKQRHECGCGQPEIVCSTHANQIVMALLFNVRILCGQTQESVGRAREWIQDVEPL